MFLFCQKSFHAYDARLLLLGGTNAGDEAGDLVLQLALADFGEWLFEGEGEHLGQADHPVCSLGASLGMHKSLRRDTLHPRKLTEEMEILLFFLFIDLVLCRRSGLLVVGLVVCRRFSFHDGLLWHTTVSQFE